MIVLSHPTVNAFNRELAEALHAAGRLAAFHTTLDWGRRKVALPRGKVRLHPWREALRLAAGRMGLQALTQHERGFASVDAVYRALDEAVAKSLDGADAVYAYEDGALVTFRAAKARGMRRFYELPIAYHATTQRLLREEAERLPAWAGTLGANLDSEEKLARKTAEISLADMVICPSRFVQSTLPPGVRGIVSEFGSPSPPPETAPRPRGGPLRLLFAGAMTQRKGLADVFAALRLLGRKDVEMVVMGAPQAPLEFYRREWPGFIHEPPRPRAQVLALMDTCDVLALPSIVEGRALVQQEALSRGLPLLVTANAGGEDLIEPGVTGWLVPIRDPAAIAERVAWLADNREALPEMRAAARRKAAALTWADYTRKILAAIDAEEV
jgi:glycosyltransferase involved in cell wall biosynthesis